MRSSYLAFFGTVGLLGAAILVRMFVHKVGPDEIGVRTQNFGILGETGVYPSDYDQPGWYRNFWYIDNWHAFDKTVQTLRMTGVAGDNPPLTIKSKDGYDVTVSVVIKYKIKKSKAFELVKNFGADPRSYQTLVANEAANACRIQFGQMITEGFYSPKGREEAAEAIKAELQKTLEPRNLEIVDILLSGVQFDPQYEKKIKDKKLADQDVALSKSRAHAAEYKGLTLKVRAETEALANNIEAQQDKEIATLRGETSVQVTTILEGAQAYAMQRRAGADALLKRAQATAELKVKQAEADGERARTEAMTGPGGRTLVALEAARNLRIGKVDFSTLGVDPLDVEKMAIRLGMPR